ncbi:hypothetical protein WN48_03240 [Eufriesea mexicana]|uniref:trichohyalin-like n=1 Tax=Eufriesea mexicana TaxID=516756 RepID=UPI00083BC9BF|nr:PREDICTED: trichohyalin-like [Eufriesea mexicana]OAD56553.1 hypothetical protein WN48_03240 [Eufriesea mexicana]
MIKEQDGKGDEDYERIKDQKAAELEERRRIIEKISEKKRHLRQLHIERKEELEAEKLQRAKKVAALKIRQLDRTQRLAEELSRRKHIELQESIKSKKTKSAAPSLSDEALQKIQAELMTKRKQDEEVRSSSISSPWDIDKDTEMKKRERKLSYRRDLQNQLIDNRRRLREKEEEKHRERKIMEEVGEALHQENLEAERRKKEIAAMLQEERDAFLKARQFWKGKRREVLKQEHDEILRIIGKKEALQKMEAEGKSDTRAAKDAVLEQLMNKLIEEKRKKVEREDICRELYLAEKEQESANEGIKQALRKKLNARELLRDMARNQKAVAERKAKEDAIDAAFAKYLADERRKEEEKEKLKEQARREKVAQYGNELREIIEQNKIQRSKNDGQTRFESSTNHGKRNVNPTRRPPLRR